MKFPVKDESFNEHVNNSQVTKMTMLYTNHLCKHHNKEKTQRENQNINFTTLHAHCRNKWQDAWPHYLFSRNRHCLPLDWWLKTPLKLLHDQQLLHFLEIKKSDTIHNLNATCNSNNEKMWFIMQKAYAPKYQRCSMDQEISAYT